MRVRSRIILFPIRGPLRDCFALAADLSVPLACAQFSCANVAWKMSARAATGNDKSAARQNTRVSLYVVWYSSFIELNAIGFAHE